MKVLLTLLLVCCCDAGASVYEKNMQIRAAQIVAKADLDGDSRVTNAEIEKWLEKDFGDRLAADVKLRKDHAAELFDAIDKEGNTDGFVTKTELFMYNTDPGRGKGGGGIQNIANGPLDLFKIADENRDDKLDGKEFYVLQEPLLNERSKGPYMGAHVDQALKSLDDNRDNLLSTTELAASKVLTESSPELEEKTLAQAQLLVAEELKRVNQGGSELFKFCDLDESGRLDRAELTLLLFHDNEPHSAKRYMRIHLDRTIMPELEKKQESDNVGLSATDFVNDWSPSEMGLFDDQDHVSGYFPHSFASKHFRHQVANDPTLKSVKQEL